LKPLTYEAYAYCTPLYNYLLNKYVQCWQSADYWAALGANKISESVSVVYVDETDVASGRLLVADGSRPRFGMLIVPDLYQGTTDAISSLLGSAGRAALQTYVNSGGLIFSSGKG
jgi:hypothetical protein